MSNNIFCCKPKNNNSKQPVIIVKTLQERDNIPCKLRVEGLIVIVTSNNYIEYQLRPTLENSLCSNNAWVIHSSGTGESNVHANSFKIKGGTGENVLLDNGTVKSLSEINASLIETIDDLTERINTLESRMM